MSKRGYDFRDPIIQKVVEKFISRSDVGFDKYKVTLDEDSKSINEWLNNIQEEFAASKTVLGFPSKDEAVTKKVYLWYKSKSSSLLILPKKLTLRLFSLE